MEVKDHPSGKVRTGGRVFWDGSF